MYFKNYLLGIAAGSMLLIGGLAPAEAAGPVRTGAVVQPARSVPVYGHSAIGTQRIDQRHPPGWDWQRTYPWSPYNAWRNPYWYPPYNGYYPYPPAQAYPYYYAVPYAVPVTSTFYYDAQQDAAAPPQGQAAPQSPLPRPTGELRTPPPQSALIQVRVPEQFTRVTFNGQQVVGVGTNRTYVVPELQAGRQYSYTVSATVNRNGQQVLEQRQIDVTVGQVVRLDFMR